MVLRIVEVNDVMDDRPDLTLIFPAYNERNSIDRTVHEALEYFAAKGQSIEIIVAADGTDGTREAVAEIALSHPNVRAIGSEKRCGKGHGIRQAVRLARGLFIGFSDADNKTPIDNFERVWPLLQSGERFVTGSRIAPKTVIKQKQKWYRQIGSRMFAVVVRSLIGLWDVPDTQCGFKFFPRVVAKRLFAVQQVDSYMFDVEILVLAKRMGITVRSVPITWRDDADSRLDLVSGNIRNGLDILKIAFSCRTRATARKLTAAAEEFPEHQQNPIRLQAAA